jgi:hypothetical protein
MMGKVSKKEFDALLEKRYKGKYVKFSYPGYKDVYARCERIVTGEPGTRDDGTILIFLNDKRYSISPEMLIECLTLLKPDNGNTPAGEQQSSEGTPEDD